MATVSQPTQRDKLWDAISQNDLEKVQKLLFSGNSGGNIDLNEPYEINVRKGHSPMNPMANLCRGVQTKKITFLLHACLVSSPILVTVLVKAGANVNKGGMVMYKLDKTDVSSRDVYEIDHQAVHVYATPLRLAVIQRNVELVEKLIHRCDVDVNVRNHAGVTALHLAVKPANGFKLLNKYTNIDQSRMDLSPQCEEIARLLLKAGATVDVQDKEGQTPLHFAAMENDVATAKILLQYGARTDVPNHEGLTPVHMSHMSTCRVLRHEDLTHYEICKLLIQETNSSALNSEKDGTTILHAMIERISMIDTNCYRCESMKLPNPGLEEVTDTIEQCREEAVTVVKLLIEKGANLEVKMDHLTPLHLAAKGGLLNIVQILVEAGADIRAETPNTGLTPLDMAEHGGKEEVVNYLKEWRDSASVRVHVEGDEGATGLCGFLTKCCSSRGM